MPDTNDTNTNYTNNKVADPALDGTASATPIIPDLPADEPDLNSVIVGATAPEAPAEENAEAPNILSEVATKIAESHNILIALSSDPSVDEMAAAIGLSLYLDRIGKRVTAIYSGNTPNALEFLNPEETFEQDTDVLRDFVIALNKEKADHLRYKVDGDYVKIFITPYRSRVSNEDLEFSYGDYNVDLVLALDVANGADLDDALREHGRIMHDASIINITTGKPGKLGEIEWSDKDASSVSEMIAELLYAMNAEEFGKEEATAFLTGIIAATDRFANAVTTPRTMKISSRLMESGANQQLISKNITKDTENEFLHYSKVGGKKPDGDPTKLDIEHSEEDEDNLDADLGDGKEIVADVAEKDNTLLEDLKAAEASLATVATEVTETKKEEPLRIDSDDALEPSETEDTMPAAPETPAEISAPETVAEEATTPETPLAPSEPEVVPAGPRIPDGPLTPVEPAPEESNSIEEKPETVVTTPPNLSGESLGEGTNKFGRMLEDELAKSGGVPTTNAPITSPSTEEPVPTGPINPAVSAVPDVPTKPEINGVPEINYMPLPGDEVLPPPPAPPIDFDTNVAAAMPQPTIEPAIPEAPAPAAPTPEAPTSLGPQPAMQDQVYRPQAASPDAFKIPGM